MKNFPLRIPLAAAALAAAALPGPATAQDREEGLAVTVYSAPTTDPSQMNQFFNPRTGAWEYPSPGFSVIKERRRVVLQPGRTVLRHQGVAAGIDGSTVLFRSLTDPEGTKVLEQSFEYDLADANRILEKYLGQSVTVLLADGVAVGKLLSFDAGQIVLEGADGLRILQRGEGVRGINTGPLPAGFVTKPTLVWMVEAAQAGSHLVETAYETSGMSWAADYGAVVNGDETKVDLTAWVTLRNDSGASYPDAALKLVAGDLNRVPKQGFAAPNMVMAAERSAAMGGADTGFTEKSFFEYHLYTLGRRTSLPDRSLKQIELFDPVAGVPCRKVYIYDGTRGMQPWWGGGPNMDENFGETGNRKVGVWLEIENREANGLGIPLPAGRMRVHKRDEADGFPELVGEDRVEHTPKDEKVRLRMGDAFDIVGERRRTAFRSDYEHKRMEESFEIKVRNHKKEAVEVLVAERLFRWITAEIVEKNTDFVRKDAQLVHFPVTIAPGGEAVVTYTVKYTW